MRIPAKRFPMLCALVALGVTTAANAETKLGIMVSSFGDVDAKHEIEPFVKKTLLDKDVAPLPDSLRPAIVWAGWELKKKSIFEEYEAIGGATHFRATSLRQVTAVANELRELGYDAKGYAGFTMTNPSVADALDQMRRDGVNRVIIFYQGAQWSRPTSYIVYRNSLRYLDEHPEWNAHVTMVRSFSDDPRFRQLLVDSINERLASDFSDYKRNEVCLGLPMHGNPMPLVLNGDPGYGQMMRVVEFLKGIFPDMPVYHGFQNHDELSSNWTMPDIHDVMVQVGNDACRAVLINGRISFTVDSLETLYDHAINEKSIVQDVAPHKPVFVEKMFNDDPKFVDFLTIKALEALDGRGDLVDLRAPR